MKWVSWEVVTPGSPGHACGPHQRQLWKGKLQQSPCTWMKKVPSDSDPWIICLDSGGYQRCSHFQFRLFSGQHSQEECRSRRRDLKLTAAPSQLRELMNYWRSERVDFIPFPAWRIRTILPRFYKWPGGSWWNLYIWRWHCAPLWSKEQKGWEQIQEELINGH